MRRGGNKEAMEIAAAFFKGNVALSLGAIALLILIAMLQMVPVVGILFAFTYSILSLAVQVYLARQIPEIESSEAMAQVATRTKLGEFFTRYLDVAAGGFLGFFLIVMLLGIFLMGLMSFSIGIQGLNTQDMSSLVASIFTSGAILTLLLMVIIVMWLTYVMPGVMGEVFLADGFNQAFIKSFLLFSPSFWKRTFSKEYFILILIWSIVVFVAAVVLSWLSASIFLLPVALIGLYFLSLYNAAVYVFAREALAE